MEELIMQRKPTRNTRGPSADEKKFQGWLKEQPCVWCGTEGPSIVDHCKGATFKHNKVLIGHWFCILQCFNCDMQKTIHGKRQGNESRAWLFLSVEFERVLGIEVPLDVFNSIGSWDK